MGEMRFSEWQAKIQTLHESLQRTNFAEISESISADNLCVTITIGKVLIARRNGTEISIKYLRTDYTARKQAFQSLLESLQAQTTETLEALERILAVVTAERIPGEIINRMKGEGEGADSVEMAQDMVRERLFQLAQTLFPSAIRANLDTFSIKLTETLKVEYNYTYQWTTITWGEIEGRISYGELLEDCSIIGYRLETCLAFLQEFPQIEARIMHLCQALDNFIVI